MDVAKPYTFIVFGAMDVTKPYKFIGFGAMDVTKPYKFIRFGATFTHNNVTCRSENKFADPEQKFRTARMFYTLLKAVRISGHQVNLLREARPSPNYSSRIRGRCIAAPGALFAQLLPCSKLSSCLFCVRHPLRGVCTYMP